MKQPRATGPLDATLERPVYDPSGWFLYRGHLAMQNRRFPEVFEAFFEEVRASTVVEIGAARGGFTYFLSEMRARFGFRLSAYDVREHDELMAIVSAERIPFATLDVHGAETFERISAEIRSDGISVVCCDGGAKVLEVRRFGGVLKPGDFILAHDYAPSREYFEKEMRGRIWEWLEITDADVAEACAAHGLVAYEQDWFLQAAWLCLRRGAVDSPRLGLRPRPAPPVPASPTEIRALIVRVLAASHSSAARAALEATLRGPIDWEAVLDMAKEELVSALLYRAIRDVRAVPRAVVALLRDPYRQTSARRLSLLHALEELVAALCARGIEPLALPGAGLDLVHEHVDLRCRNDFDLLLERDEVDGALDVLGSLGYTAAPHAYTPGATLRSEKKLTLSRHAGVAIRLVLRWCLFDSAAQPANGWLRATARRISIGAAPALILGPEAQLLHLARHIRGNDLHRLHAIAGLIAAHSERIDFPLLFSRASEWGVVEPLRCSLLAVDADWHAPLPPDARRELLALPPS